MKTSASTSAFLLLLALALTCVIVAADVKPLATPAVDWSREMKRPEAQRAIYDWMRQHCYFTESPFHPEGQPVRTIPYCVISDGGSGTGASWLTGPDAPGQE